ncbi:uncharacterized protein LOC126371763 [Pectinophora gossypiella]|nr:uncharacterized protein LOC126371763 [Pectinophora gossypiella]
MPEEDIGDLSDVVDAINKLCDTMKTSTYDEPYDDCQDDTLSMTSTLTSQYDSSYETASVTRTLQHECSQEPPPVPVRRAFQREPDETAAVTQSEVMDVAEAEEVETQSDYRDIELVSPEEGVAQTAVPGAERWSDATSVSLPGQVEDAEAVTSDTDPGNAQCEPVSEMYYTASSEVSLLSDTELPDNKVQNEDEDREKDDRKNVIAGHVAAMRERFESMTRTNTPCPDLIRSLSPSLEVFRNTSPSPDHLA